MCTFPAFRSKGEALNLVCFDETEPSEETSVRMLKLSDFYEFETSLPSNHPNAELSLARAHHRWCAREGVPEYDATVTDWVADTLSVVSRLRSFSEHASILAWETKTSVRAN